MQAVRVQNVTMDYPGVRALDEVSIGFRAGEIHALIGENGAGKSTLLKILSGIQPPSSGEILIDDELVRFSGVKAAEHAGIAMVHQELNLVDTLSVADNIALGSELHRFGVVKTGPVIARAQAALRRLSAHTDPRTMVGTLSLASKQLVEIAKALAHDAKLLILDEPTAVLAEAETKSLLELVKLLKSEGVGVIYVSHRLDEVCAIADTVTVLRDGKVASQVDRTAGLEPKDLANRMVGRELQDLFPPKVPPKPDAEAVLQVEGAVFEGFAAPISFEVRAGEIVGLGGLIGAGRTEVAQGIIRQRGLQAGFVTTINPAYVSEDRKGTGLHLTLDLSTNITLANLTVYGANASRQRQAAKGWINRLGIRASGPDAIAQSLSGGNQQKVSLAKWLDRQPRLLILDEPTRGVDIGAKTEIYRLIAEFAREGMGCLVISSEMNELIGLCHRVLIMRDRQIAGELTGDQITEGAMMMLAAGVAA